MTFSGSMMMFITLIWMVWNDDFWQWQILNSSYETFILSDGICTQCWCEQRRQLERQRDGGWRETHRDRHQDECQWQLHCQDPRQVRLVVQSHFFSGMATCGPTGAKQTKFIPAKKKLWNSVPRKTLSTWPATAGTPMASLTPCKQRPQQAGVGDPMGATPPLGAGAFDLPLQQAMDWGSTTSLGIRLLANASSGSWFNTIKLKSEWLFCMIYIDDLYELWLFA